MEYKILINSKGVPVLVEVPKFIPNLGEAIVGNTYRRSDDYDNRVKAILSDENKHIAFKDEARVIDLLSRKELCSPLIVRTVGQTFDLPENIGVSFEYQIKSLLREDQWNTINERNYNDAINSMSARFVRRIAILTPKPVKEPTCGDCGQELTLVRPGKHQCDNPNCVQNNPKPESVPSQQAKIHKSEIIQRVLDNITPEEIAETERKMMEESVPSCGEENVPHDAINLLNLNFGNSKVAYWTIKDRIAVLMQEFAQQSMKQERERAIQECIDVADKFYNDSKFGIGKNLHEILVEKLKK